MQLSAIKTVEGTLQSCQASCAGQQSSEGSQHSPSHAGGLPGKLSKPSQVPRHHRWGATSPLRAQPLD